MAPIGSAFRTVSSAENRAQLPNNGEYTFDTFDSDLWTLHNSATYDSNNNRAQIVPNAADREGQLEYDYKDIDYGVEVTYEIIVQDSGSSGFFSAQFFADGYDKRTLEDSFSNIDNAINVVYNPSNSEIRVNTISGNSTSDSSSYSIGTGTYTVTVRIDPSNDSASATIDDGSGNSATASITDSDVSTFVAGDATDTFVWDAGHFSDSGRKSVDNITIDRY